MITITISPYEEKCVFGIEADYTPHITTKEDAQRKVLAILQMFDTNEVKIKHTKDSNKKNVGVSRTKVRFTTNKTKGNDKNVR